MSDDNAESDGIKVVIKDGKASLYKEPFMKLDIATEKDFEILQEAIKIRDHLKTCNFCANGGTNKCNEFQKEFPDV